MPYNKPKRSGTGFILPKKEGGAHESASGKVVHFKSAEAAKKAGDYIMAIEHGFHPTKMMKKKKH